MMSKCSKTIFDKIKLSSNSILGIFLFLSINFEQTLAVHLHWPKLIPIETTGDITINCADIRLRLAVRAPEEILY